MAKKTPIKKTATKKKAAAKKKNKPTVSRSKPSRGFLILNTYLPKRQNNKLGLKDDECRAICRTEGIRLTDWTDEETADRVARQHRNDHEHATTVQYRQ